MFVVAFEKGTMFASGCAVIKDVNVCFEPDGDSVVFGQSAGLLGNKGAAAGSQDAGRTLKKPFHNPLFAGAIFFFAEAFQNIDQ